jgi:hypothetical protein
MRLFGSSAGGATIHNSALLFVAPVALLTADQQNWLRILTQRYKGVPSAFALAGCSVFIRRRF